MRILYRTVAFIAISGCMSNGARVSKNKSKAVRAEAANAALVESPLLATPQVEPASPAPSTPSAIANETTPPVDTAISEAAPAKVEKSPCDDQKKDVTLPYFIKETSTLVVGLDQKCKTPTGATEATAVSANMSVIGVACTGAPGLITRRGHSNQNWELVAFGMDLGCNMHPAEEVKSQGRKILGMATDPQIVAFVPMLIEYWEFESNNDAGLSSTPTLTADGGGAAQWKKNETKSTGFPIKLYGRSSMIGRNQDIYEARAVLLPRSNQRQFEVQVKDMRALNPDELKVTFDHCIAKTKSNSGCREAFDVQ